jgi:osmoprotectant transport system permease protein
MKHEALRDVLLAFVEHVDLCVCAVTGAVLLAFPVSLWMAQRRVVSEIVIAACGLLYTVPSLALLALLVTLFGLGKPSALLALMMYAQFILIRHFILGLRSVDPTVREVARGLGLSPGQMLFSIEMPLAMPVWLSGLRIATLSTIGIASIAAWINAGGLGRLIFEGISQSNSGKIILGALLISGLAFLFESILQGFEAQAISDMHR